MGLVLGGMIFALTCLWCLVIAYANGMASAPGMNDILVWPWFVGGTLLSLLLVLTHWVGM